MNKQTCKLKRNLLYCTLSYWKLGNIHGYSSVIVGVFSHMMFLDYLLTSKNIWWIIDINRIEAVTLLVTGFKKGENLKKQNRRRKKNKE